MARLICALGLAAGLHVTTVPAAAQSPDEVITTIEAAAARHGVSPAWLVAVARCETRGDPFNPRAVGDRGTSFGVFQLHRGGLLDDFWARGYGDPMNVWEAADYAAAAFARGLSSHWSCAR